MQFSAAEIKDRLLQALGTDYNVKDSKVGELEQVHLPVIDMGAVLEIIDTLEQTAITKDALEQTRLGKYINELRKRTSDANIAKRAKRLVRNWQKLISAPADSPTLPASHGTAPPSQPDSRTTSPTPNKHTESAFISQPSGGPPRSPGASTEPPPLRTHTGNSNDGSCDAEGRARTLPSTPVDNTWSSTKRKRGLDCASNGHSKTLASGHGVRARDFTPDWIRERTNVLNGVSEPEPPSTDHRPDVDASGDTPRQSKVKTTAQLIQELQSKSGTKLYSRTIDQITRNKIEKEPDNEYTSVVPAGARPRPRRKPQLAPQLPLTSDRAMQQAKTELVEKFLQSSVAPAEMEDLSPDPVRGTSPDPGPASPRLCADADEVADRVGAPGQAQDEHPAQRARPPEYDDPWAHLPLLDRSTVDLYEEPDPPRSPVSCSEALVSNMASQQLPGLNGVRRGPSWTDWSECMSVPVPDVGPDYQLYILPYVDIETPQSIDSL